MWQLLKWHWRGGKTSFFWVFAFLIWAFVGLFGIQSAKLVNSAEPFDRFFLALAGPFSQDDRFYTLFIWLAPLLLLIVGIGNVGHTQLLGQGMLILPRIGSRRTWYRSFLIYVALRVAFYLLFGVTVVAMISLWDQNLSGDSVLWNLTVWAMPLMFSKAELFWHLLCLLYSSWLALIFLQTVIGLIAKNGVIGWITIFALLIFSWFLGSNLPTLAPWWIGESSILMRHVPFDPLVPSWYSINLSIIINLGLIGLSVIAGEHYLMRYDISVDREKL